MITWKRSFPSLSILRDSLILRSTFIESYDQEQALNSQINKPVRIILPYKDQRSGDLVRRQLSDLAKKTNSDSRPMFTSKKIAMRSKWQNPNHLLLTNNALFMNTNVVWVRQVMWAIHVDTCFSAYSVTVNTCGTSPIWGRKIFVTNLQSSRIQSKAGLFNLWNALRQKQHLTLNLTLLK